MKTKIIILTSLISACLLAGTSALAAGPRGGNGGGPAGNGTGTPVRDGSGKAVNNRGNPKSTGTPVLDGSGKATAPGQGAKDGTGNQANCPTPPKT
jgi:hypothetical protein